jgi:CRISPR-associated endonuclease/helicase Cas3
METKALDVSCCLAKSLTLQDGKKVPGIDVLGHCVIVGEVAKEIVRRSLPAIQDALFPPGSELIAAAHDVGKVSPAFQEKIYRAIDGYRHNSLPGLETANPDQEKNWGGHPGVSQAALEGRPRYIREIAGRHHGYSPGESGPGDSVFFGGMPWQKRREELLEKLHAHFDVPWPAVKDTTQAAVLSGLTCVADWIGSGSAFDGLRHIEDATDLPDRVQAALSTAGFIRPIMKPGLSFTDIFGPDFVCRPAQSHFIESVTAPGVYVLEAPMGMGKTEAALYAAYKSIAAGHASGIYFALPTRLTSDKIYQRMNSFLNTVLDEASPLRRSLLLHSSAWLYETELGEEGEPGASWFRARKRGILAPFAVGTIDQALMAVMNVKHGFVRAFGLAGKVVILDEVHSYDSYTGTLLDELVQGLRDMSCTVIILSATLTDERRRSLLRIPAAAVPVSAYPLISALPQGEALHELPVDVTDRMEVSIRRVADDGEAVEEALKRAEQGQQVLWIENTVQEAQKRYELLASRATECGIATGLLHSRFVQHDRECNEDRWVALFGKEGKAQRGEQGRILVGTQVLEQSLDIDADFLITRLAPTDMLLQRIGRLWRHRDHDPIRPSEACCEAWILSADYEKVLKNYKKVLGKTVYVYAPYILLRTLEVWETKTALQLPDDIRTLVEKTYLERHEEGLLGTLQQAIAKEREKLRRFALLGVSQAGKTLPESKAKTRYSDRETRDLLLLKSARKNQDGSIALLLSNGEALELPRDLKNRDRKAWRKLAAALSRHLITVPKNQAPFPAPAGILDWFKEYLYVGSKEHDEGSLRIALIKESGDLAGIDYTEVCKDFLLSYDKTIGYRAEKIVDTGNEEDDW